MPKIKKIIIICIVICIILAITITTLIIIQKNKNKSRIVSEEVPEEVPLNYNLHAITDRSIYYAVRSCAFKYYSYYLDMFNSNNVSTNEKNENIISSEAIYEMLDEEYIKIAGITKKNVQIKLSRINDSDVDIAQIYESEKTDNIAIYLVNGVLIEKNTNKITNFQIIVEIDSNTKAFKILPNEYAKEKIGNNGLGSTIEMNEPNQIKRNSTNTYTYSIVNDNIHILQIFSQYKNYLMYNKQEAYNRLDEQYKSKEFQNIQKFNQYVKEHKIDDITNALANWKVIKTQDGNLYVITDSMGNKYTFTEKSIMDYTVQLKDTTEEIYEYRYIQ